MNEKCKEFFLEIFKKFKKWHHTVTCLNTGSPECLFGALFCNAQMIQK
jgi:hypothetical protein